MFVPLKTPSAQDQSSKNSKRARLDLKDLLACYDSDEEASAEVRENYEEMEEEDEDEEEEGRADEEDFEGEEEKEDEEMEEEDRIEEDKRSEEQEEDDEKEDKNHSGSRRQRSGELIDCSLPQLKDSARIESRD
ncbi:unnamed protein product [Tilletia controversa]|nr:unnamed protein product [Tilletia controversa]